MAFPSLSSLSSPPNPHCQLWEALRHFCQFLPRLEPATLRSRASSLYHYTTPQPAHLPRRSASLQHSTLTLVSAAHDALQLLLQAEAAAAALAFAAAAAARCSPLLLAAAAHAARCVLLLLSLLLRCCFMLLRCQLTRPLLPLAPAGVVVLVSVA